MIQYDLKETPWGTFLFAGSKHGLCVLDYQQGPKFRPIDPSWNRNTQAFEGAFDQLMAYFDGAHTRFNMAIDPKGTPFQKTVWDYLKTIPYGQTVTYMDVAIALGKPNAVRAVGGAIGRNPIQIIIPCHRVIGKDGGLTGYAGGLDMKQRLLDLENG